MNTSVSAKVGSLTGPVSAQALENVLRLCIKKTRANIRRLADEPRSAAWALDGNYFSYREGFFEIGNWTSSFFTGMALLAWRETEDEYFLQQVLRLAPHYREKVFVCHLDTHHDLGFLTSLYSVALYKLTGGEEHRQVGLRAAEVLAGRFNERGSFIRAWGRMDENDPRFPANMAIIDCLMNLPLLYWASGETGNARFKDIAVRHAQMVLRHFVRPDYSVYHAFRFDQDSGKPIGPDNFCGAGTESYWARGTAWAIYGFALSYGYTGDTAFLDASIQIAKRFLAELDKDTEVVPVWDFRLPAGAPRVRDASAAAIGVCGLQELAKHGASVAEFPKAECKLLARLCSDDYLDARDECPGVLKSAYGDKPAYSSWGDYFLMEAVVREARGGETFW
jgi:unsaturated chondroitin disaccharide hydrolase